MQRSGARARRRPRARHRRSRPSLLYLACALLLILSFGITLAGIHDSFVEHDYLWCMFFGLAATLNAALYLWVVHWWLKWLN